MAVTSLPVGSWKLKATVSIQQLSVFLGSSTYPLDSHRVKRRRKRYILWEKEKIFSPVNLLAPIKELVDHGGEGLDLLAHALPGGVKRLLHELPLHRHTHLVDVEV